MNYFKDQAENSQASQNKYELEILLRLMNSFQVENILEIGGWKGYLYQTFIDTFPKLKELVSLEIGNISDLKPLYQNPIHNQWFGSDSHKDSTFDTVKIYLPSADMIFIDGDHTLEGVAMDFMMYSPIVKSDGMICFHDINITNNPGVQVYEFWNEVKKSYKHLEIINPDHGMGIGVLFV